MTDLAAHLVTLAAHVDRIGVSCDDIIGTQVSVDGVMTLHLRTAAVYRLVSGWGDVDTRESTDHVVDGVVISHHHRIAIRDTDRKVVLLWIIPAAKAQAA